MSSKINSQGDVCDQEDCNRLALIAGRQGNYFVFNFDDTNFNNGEYRMTARAYSWMIENMNILSYPKNQATINFVIDKGLIGETGGTYQGSKVLNIILAKIKTWI